MSSSRPLEGAVARDGVLDLVRLTAYPNSIRDPVLGRLPTSESKQVQIAARLRDAIFDGELLPAQQIVESRLAREMGVSQTPIREALAILLHEGLVTKIPHLGTFVAEVSREELYDVSLVRAVLEGLVARLVIERADVAELSRLDEVVRRMAGAVEEEDDGLLTDLDVEFHQITYELARHESVQETLSNLQRRMRLSLVLAGTGPDDRRSERYRSHIPLLAALRAGDPQRAELVARDHAMQSAWLLFGEGESRPTAGLPGPLATPEPPA